jgi:hypothetical protein
MNTFKNRIAKHDDNPPIEPPKIKTVPNDGKWKHCGECLHQLDGICNRYPFRYIVKDEQGFMPACGEFK